MITNKVLRVFLFSQHTTVLVQPSRAFITTYPLDILQVITINITKFSFTIPHIASYMLSTNNVISQNATVKSNLEDIAIVITVLWNVAYCIQVCLVIISFLT